MFLHAMSRLPKPVAFAALGAIGGVLGGLVGELILGAADSPPADAPPVAVCLLLDSSSSMTGDKLAEMRNAACQFIDRQRDTDTRIAVVGFDSRVNRLASLSEANSRLTSAVNRLRANGGTNMGDGLLAAADELEDASLPRYILLFTDGQPNNPDETLRAAEACRERGLKIIGIVTVDVDRRYMNELTGDASLVFQAAQGDFAEAFGAAERKIFSLVHSSGSAADDSLLMIVLVGLWTGVLTIGTGLGLVIGQNTLMRRPLVTVREAAMVVIGGLMVGLASGGLSQAAFSIVAHIQLLRLLGQVAGWTLMGGLLAMGMSLFVPNLKPLLAGGGGALGGLVGSIGFLLANQVFGLIGLGGLGEMLGRLTGIVILGAGIGAMVAIVERLARSAFLRVHWETGQWSRVSLGPQRVLIGSSSQAHVSIPSDSVLDIASAVTFVDGRIDLHDRVDDHHEELRVGQRINYGPVVVEVCSEAASESPDPPPAPTPPPIPGQETPAPPAPTPPPPRETEPERARSPELTLQAGTGHSIRCRIKTRLSKSTLRECGEDSQFADSEFQCDLVPIDGGWQVVPNTAAPNETLLNGRKIDGTTPLSTGDVLAVGREAKGIVKLPLEVRF